MCEFASSTSLELNFCYINKTIWCIQRISVSREQDHKQSILHRPFSIWVWVPLSHSAALIIWSAFNLPRIFIIWSLWSNVFLWVCKEKVYPTTFGTPYVIWINVSQLDTQINREFGRRKYGILFHFSDGKMRDRVISSKSHVPQLLTAKHEPDFVNPSWILFLPNTVSNLMFIFFEACFLVKQRKSTLWPIDQTRPTSWEIGYIS